MLDKAIYEYVLSKLNLNTQEITFKGNFLFVRYNDSMTLLSADTYNPYDLTDTKFVGVAESTSIETPYSESNNRSGWTKRYVFMFDYEDNEEVLTALEETRDYFLANRVHTIDSKTFVWRVSRPSFGGNQQQNGTINSTYYMDFFGDSVETGNYMDSATHKMCIYGGTLQDIIIDSSIISYTCNMNPSNIMTGEYNTFNSPVSDGVGIQMTINYDSTTLLETLYKHITGKYSRETKYTYQTVFDSITQSYDLYIASGSIVYQNGVLTQLTINFVEV